MLSVFVDKEYYYQTRTKAIKKKEGGRQMEIIKRNCALERKLFRLLHKSNSDLRQAADTEKHTKVWYGRATSFLKKDWWERARCGGWESCRGPE
jgi:hypothetical protein